MLIRSQNHKDPYFCIRNEHPQKEVVPFYTGSAHFFEYVMINGVVNHKQWLKKHNFRVFLKQELARRCAKNPAYSLRSFAKLLGVSHASLSQIITGKRPLTKKTQLQIAEALALSPEQLINFQISKEIRFDEHFKGLDLEQFDIFSDWIHDAILELTHLKYFKAETRWIATVLDVNPNTVSAAVDRLVRAKLLVIDRKGKWKDVSHNNTNNHLGDFTNSALKKYQKDLLDKSAQALEALPRDERDHTSLMLNFSKKNVKEAKAV